MKYLFQRTLLMANLTQPTVQMDRPQLKVNKQLTCNFPAGEKLGRFKVADFFNKIPIKKKLLAV